jgi:cytoskeletal protein RodZ
MAKTDPQERSANRRKRKSKAKNKVSYSFVLLSLMLIVGCISGLVAFVFGQQALQGVNPVPLGGKLPRQAVPPEKPSKKANTNSFWDDNRKAISWSQQDDLEIDAKKDLKMMNLIRPTNVTLLSSKNSADLDINSEVKRLNFSQNIPLNNRFLAKHYSIAQLDLSGDRDIKMDVSISQKVKSLVLSR